MLIASRALLAVGAAAMMPATLALIRLSFNDVKERNIAIAIWGSLSVVGASLGPILGGLLLERFWWGSVFLINVPVVVSALIGTALVAPRNDADPSKKWDLLSSIQAMVGLVGTVLFIKELAHVPQNWPLIAGAAVAAVVGFVLFVRRQRRMSEPLLEFSISATRLSLEASWRLRSQCSRSPARSSSRPSASNSWKGSAPCKRVFWLQQSPSVLCPRGYSGLRS
ncbi:MFS transporter [Micrococcus luteus]|uniref:MFS transporter n=1 Tax=Micrococcus luteus TaxID=1270 RepID=UPI0027B8CA0D|nr:MFS transporter [Micrococcus luteus]